MGPVADTTAASQPDAFSLADSEEFYVVSREGMPEMGMEGSEGEEGGETEEEDWREEWEDLGMQLREGARRKVVITTFTTSEAEVAEDGRHDSGYYEDYDFDYWKVIAALQEPQEESLGGDLGARSGGVRKQLRQIALGDSDDEEEDVDVELVERSQDLGSMRTRDGGVAGGDVWWR